MSEPDDAKKTSTPTAGQHWAKSFGCIGVAAIVFLGFPAMLVFLIRSLVPEISISEKTVTEFREAGLRISGTPKLQIAQLQIIEEVPRVDSKSLEMEIPWFDKTVTVNLPDVKATVSLPVEFTYVCDLQKDWSFSYDEEGRTLTVVAPPIEWNRPAVDVSRMREEFTTSIARFGEEEVLGKLKRELTDILNARAASHVGEIRLHAEKSVETFVNQWLSEKFYGGKPAPVRTSVRFAEAPSSLPHSSPPLADVPETRKGAQQP